MFQAPPSITRLLTGSSKLTALTLIPLRQKLSKLSPRDISASELAGERIVNLATTAPGNGAAIGGLKVSTDSGWFAARPSGTENVYKLYAESFVDAPHLRRIQSEAQAIIAHAFGANG